MSEAISVREELLDEPGAAAMMAGFEQEIASRYPGWQPENAPPFEARDVEPPRGRLVVAYVGETPVGCGALKRLDDERVEVRRVFVAPEARRRGVARALMERLEQLAREAGYAAVRLETGGSQPEACALYEELGYHEIGAYNGNPWARHWFEKAL